MCGIVGYAGSGDAPQILIEALKRLEYRGYDSAGIAVQENGGLTIHKKQGRISVMEETLPKLKATVGIGHTRWATHGEPSDANAHPQVDSSGDIAVIHNGTLENYADLRSRMEAAGIEFNSGTDTEVLPHLIARHYDGNLLAAVRAALGEVTGAYAIVVLHAAHPGEIVAARNESPPNAKKSASVAGTERPSTVSNAARTSASSSPTGSALSASVNSTVGSPARSSFSLTRRGIASMRARCAGTM